MNHQKAIYLIEGFEPGELTPRESESLQRHLAACAACAEKSANMAPLRAFFAETAAHEPDGLDAAIESVRQGTLRAIRTQSAPVVPMLAWVRSVLRVPVLVPLGAAALLLIAVAARMPGRSEGVSRETPAETGRIARLEPAAPSAPSLSEQLPAAVAPRQTSAPVRRSATRGSEASSEFVMLRKGSEVEIQWLHDGGAHRIRKAQNPVSVQVASRRVVRGDVWSDLEAPPAPGTITYYLVD